MMDYEEYPWPTDFPKDVPPAGALEADGIAYRIVKADPPCELDFVGHNKEPHVKKSGKLKPADYGTSMFQKLEEIRELKNFYAPLRKKRIACGNLIPKHGKMSPPDHKSHFETWLRLKTKIENSFKVLE